MICTTIEFWRNCLYLFLLVTSSFLLLVVRPGAPLVSSVLAPSSDALWSMPRIAEMKVVSLLIPRMKVVAAHLRGRTGRGSDVRRTEHGPTR